MFAFVIPLALGQLSAGLFTKPVYLAESGPPTLVMAIDTVARDRGGLLILDPRDRANLDFHKFSELGKLCQPSRARNGFAEHTIAAAAGKFAPGETVCVAVLTSDGVIHLEHGFDAEKGTFSKDDPAGTMPPASAAEKGTWRALPFQTTRSTTSDLLLVRPSGKITLLANDGTGHFAVREIHGRLRASRVEQGDLDGNGVSSLVWIDSHGSVFRGNIAAQCKLANIVKVAAVAPHSGLAVGRFLNSAQCDILAGQELLPGGKPAKAQTLPEVPDAAVAKDDTEWIAADLAGDGRDDLIRVRRSHEIFTSDDIYVQYEPGAAGFCDSSNDGLPDAWKTGAINPGGLNLAAMGCKPGHKDVIVEVQPMWNVSPDHVKAEMKKVVDYFASLKVPNLDGVQGVAMHVIYREPMAKSDEGDGWPSLGNKYHPANHRGITHWMEVYHGGGGQSDIMFDRGSCGDNAMAPVFTHEFGHQLGLDHNGRWRPDGCPIYPSLMNYPYNYQLNGKREDVGYSDGKLAGITLMESHLDKYLPVPPSAISFIAGPPYHFKIKPSPDGKGTLVDWNWDGNFNEKWVAANINYGYGMTAGLRHNLGKTYTVAAPAVCGSGKSSTLLLFSGDLPSGGAAPVDDATEKEPNLSPKRPGRLRVRVWLGKDRVRNGDRWSPPQDVDTDVTGDPSCVSLEGVVWLAYPTLGGVKIRRATVQSGKTLFGDPITLPNTTGAQVTVATLEQKLAVLLWRRPTEPVTIIIVADSPRLARLSQEIPLGFTSEGPVGAAEGPKRDGNPTLLVGLSQDQNPRKPNRWQLRTFAFAANVSNTKTASSFVQLSQEWIGGERGGERVKGRTTVLWEPDSHLGPLGQVYLFATGAYSDDAPWACSYVTMRIGEKDVNGGWLTRRYYDEWTQSRTAPGVCFFKGDIFYASRWVAAKDPSNDNMFVAFFGRGIQSDPMGDFDDISFIRDYGLHRSIASLVR